MKKSIFLGMILLAGFVCSTLVFAHEDIKKHPSCKYCGMDREKFAHSRMLIEYDNGTSVGTCSLHCTAIDLALNIDLFPKFMGVGDYFGKNLIDAEKASWVIGGNKPGVMTQKAKWAFATKEGADKFIRENGGVPADFDQALKASYEDINEDTRMIRERRKMRRQQMMEKK
jgi:nitrous oxide reductase accessory protein NosL